MTGGSGLLGGALVQRALARGNDVVSVDRLEPTQRRPGVRYVVGETSDYELLVDAFAGCDRLLPHGGDPGSIPRARPRGPQQQRGGELQRDARRGRERCRPHLSGLQRQRHRSRLQPEPGFEYLPLDEHHPTAVEDPYGLSKWVCEAQADALARRYDWLSIASLRFHWVVPDRERAVRAYGNTDPDTVRQLVGLYHPRGRGARLSAGARGQVRGARGLLRHRSRQRGAATEPQSWPSGSSPAPGSTATSGATPGFFDCAKAERLLGWRHDAP